MMTLYFSLKIVYLAKNLAIHTNWCHKVIFYWLFKHRAPLFVFTYYTTVMQRTTETTGSMKIILTFVAFARPVKEFLESEP